MKTLSYNYARDYFQIDSEALSYSATIEQAQTDLGLILDPLPPGFIGRVYCPEQVVQLRNQLLEAPTAHMRHAKESLWPQGEIILARLPELCTKAKTRWKRDEALDMLGNPTTIVEARTGRILHDIDDLAARMNLKEFEIKTELLSSMVTYLGEVGYTPPQEWTDWLSVRAQILEDIQRIKDTVDNMQTMDELLEGLK